MTDIRPIDLRLLREMVCRWIAFTPAYAADRLGMSADQAEAAVDSLLMEGLLEEGEEIQSAKGSFRAFRFTDQGWFWEERLEDLEEPVAGLGGDASAMFHYFAWFRSSRPFKFPQELAAWRLGVSPPTAAKSIQRLEAAGLITQENPAPSNGQARGAHRYRIEAMTTTIGEVRRDIG